MGILNNIFGKKNEKPENKGQSRFVPEQLESGEMTAFLDGVMEG